MRMELKAEMEDTQQQQQQQEEEEEEQLQEKEEDKIVHHVLAVDDSHIDRKLLERLLTLSSYHVTCVESGNKALEYLGLVDDDDHHHQEEEEEEEDTHHNTITHSTTICSSSSSHHHQGQGSKINLIMTDYSMPGMSGYDLLKRLKGSFWKDIPVVIMSSENVPSRINMCLEGGAEEFLLKPLQLSDLRKLQSYLLKPLNHSCMSTNGDFINVENNHHNHNNDKSINNNNNTNNKRKAICPQSSDRRPKMKELAVV